MGDGFVAVSGLEDLEPGNGQGFDSDQSDEKFVFYNEDFGGHETPTCTPAQSCLRQRIRRDCRLSSFHPGWRSRSRLQVPGGRRAHA